MTVEHSFVAPTREAAEAHGFRYTLGMATEHSRFTDCRVNATLANAGGSRVLTEWTIDPSLSPFDGQVKVERVA